MSNPWRKRVEIGPHVLYLGDAIEILPALQLQGKVDAGVMDPPYSSGGFSEAAKSKAAGQGLRSETLKGQGSRLKSRASDQAGVWFAGDAMTINGAAFLIREIARHMFDLTTEHGTITVFTDWRVSAPFSAAIESARWRYQNLLVWDKESAGLGSGFRAQHELAMHFSKGSPPYHSSKYGNVLSAKRVPGEDRDHACEKPIKLLREIVETVAPEGGLVVDPFMGSGTTGVACAHRRVRFVGIEIDEGFFDVACKRLRHASAAPPDIQPGAAMGEQRDLL